MSRCHASVLIEQTTKSIEVIFSSGSQITYIGDGLATTLGLPTKAADVTTILENIAGARSTCTKTASITLILGTVQELIEAVVLPGGIDYLVLGADWFGKYHPSIDFGGNTISIVVKHTIQMHENDTGVFLAPSVRVVGHTANAEVRRDLLYVRAVLVMLTRC